MIKEHQDITNSQTSSLGIQFESRLRLLYSLYYDSEECH